MLQAEVTGQISLLSSNVEKIRTTNEKAHLELVQVRACQSTLATHVSSDVESN
jgi:hypothetical protein